MSLTGAPDRADDLAQATTLRAIEKAALFEPGTRLDAWVFTLQRSRQDIGSSGRHHYVSFVIRTCAFGRMGRKRNTASEGKPVG